MKNILIRSLALLLTVTITSTCFNGLSLNAEAEEVHTETFSDSESDASELSETDKAAYNELQTAIINIASGEQTSSIIPLSEEVVWKWTAEELGAEEITTENAETLSNEKLEELMNLIVSNLLIDYPDDFFWYDNESTINLEFSLDYTSTDVTISNVVVSLPVVAEYQGAEAYTVKIPEETNAEPTEVTAESIVAKYESGTDYEKLLGFKNEICSLLSYGEEYSKAFQYLCDLAGLTCYTVTGQINGEAHMWNIVTLNEENYLVDVANCDENMIGADELLFLVGTSEGNCEEGYVFHLLEEVTYVYDSTQVEVLGSEVLTLSTCSYEPNNSPIIENELILTPTIELCRNENGEVEGVQITNSMTIDNTSIYYGYYWDNAGEKTGLVSCDTFTAEETKIIFFKDLLIPDLEHIGKSFTFECYAEDVASGKKSESAILDYEISMAKKTYTGDGIPVTVEIDDNDQEIYRIEQDSLPENLKCMYLVNSMQNIDSELEKTFAFIPSLRDEGTTYWEANYPDSEIEIEGLILGEIIPGESSLEFVWSEVPKEAIIIEYEKSAPLIVEVSAISCTEIELKWSKSDEANGYFVYNIGTDETRNEIAKIEDSDELTYTVTKLEPNTEYSYLVVPYREHKGVVYAGEESEVVSAKTAPVGSVTLKIENVNYNQMKLTWSRNDAATGYRIYRSNVSGSGYKGLKTITSGDTLSYTDTSLSYGTTYYYKVEPVLTSDSVTYAGTVSSAVSAKTTVPPTKINAVKNVNYKTLQISWQKISGISGYEIYRSNASGSGYKLVKAITSGNTVSYQDTTVSPNTTHYYKVRAYCTVNGKKEYGSYSSTLSGKTMFAQVSGVKTQASGYKSLKISWSKVSGASKYEVYYSTSKNSGYKLLKSTSKNSYTWKKPACGTTYYFKVRALKKDGKKYVYGTDSAVVSGKTIIGKPTASIALKKKSNIKISWKKVSGAQKYELYWSTSKNGTYQRLTTTTSKSYTHSGRNSGTTYYYKVRAIRQNFVSDFSNIVSVTTPINNTVRRGVDVSEYQGSIDWKKVKKDGISFAMLRIVKGRTGSMSVDTRFEDNYKKAKKAGIEVGVYRYCYATSVAEARKEAQKVLAVLNGRKLDLPIVLDMEDSSLLAKGISNSTRAKMVLAFKEVVESAGYKFAMYANLNWTNNYLDMNQLSNVNLWLARWRDYSKGPGYTGKGKLIMWQYTSSGKVNGIKGNVDLNVRY